MGILDNVWKREEKIITLDEHQARRLVEQCKNKRDRVIFRIVLNSGIGLGETVAIRVSDIDFVQCTITIYNGRRIRNVTLPVEVIQEVKEFIGPEMDDRLLFPIKERALIQVLKAYRDNGGPKGWDWRVLRDTYAEIAIKKREDPNRIAENMGIPVAELLSLFQYYHQSSAGEAKKPSAVV